MIQRTIVIQYSCRRCGTQDVGVAVPARPSAMSVTTWVAQMTCHLSQDHEHRSPACDADTLQDVKIPITGAGWIGGPRLA